MDRDRAMYWPEPHLELDPASHQGPVRVTPSFQVAPELVPQFLEAMALVRRSRLRTGAVQWDLYRDGADPRRFVETFVVPSWEEHLRQHSESIMPAAGPASLWPACAANRLGPEAPALRRPASG